MAGVRVIYGTIGSDGSIITSGGFVSGEGTALTDRVIDVTHVDKGVFEIVFIKEFGEAPSVTATQVYARGNGKHGNTKDNAVIVNIDKGSTRIATGDDKGHSSDREFSFQAMGLAEPIR